jgi:hypothetical protein
MLRFLAIGVLLAACASSSDGLDPESPFDPLRVEEPGEFERDWVQQVKIPAHLDRLSYEDEAFVVTAVRALGSIDFQTYSAAASGLAELGEAVTPYLGHIGERASESERTFRVVAVVLAPVFVALEPERLAFHLPSAYRVVRATAAQVAGERNLMECAPVLVNLLEDQDLRVRRAAIAALRRLTNRFFGYDPAATVLRRAKPVQRWQGLLGSG